MGALRQHGPAVTMWTVFRSSFPTPPLLVHVQMLMLHPHALSIAAASPSWLLPRRVSPKKLHPMRFSSPPPRLLHNVSSAHLEPSHLRGYIRSLSAPFDFGPVLDSDANADTRQQPTSLSRGVCKHRTQEGHGEQRVLSLFPPKTADPKTKAHQDRALRARGEPSGISTSRLSRGQAAPMFSSSHFLLDLRSAC